MARNYAGKLLSQGVRDIYDEFVATMEKWHHIEYDIIDIGAATFAADYDSFRSVMRELDRRLCQVVLTAFDDCATMTATFKLLDSFEGLLDREVISQVQTHPPRRFCHRGPLFVVARGYNCWCWKCICWISRYRYNV